VSLTSDQKIALKEPLDDKRVAKRQSLSYLAGYDIIAKANEIFGFDGWQRGFCTREINALRCVVEIKRQSGDKSGWEVAYICEYQVTVGDQVVEDVGYGSGIS